MNNKTSDEKVANDIKILKKFCEYEEVVVLTDNALEEVQDAMQNILAEREQKDKRIQELEEENRIFALEGSKERLSLYIKENYIPKQKIKDKIEKLKDKLKFIACSKDCNKCFDKEGKALYRGSDFMPCFAYHQIKILQELLKESEDK